MVRERIYSFLNGASFMFMFIWFLMLINPSNKITFNGLVITGKLRIIILILSVIICIYYVYKTIKGW